MLKSKVAFFLLFVLLTVASGLSGGVALASDGGGSLELYTPYPVVKDISGQTFRYEVELKYEGSQTRTFDLSVTPIPGWKISIKPLIKRQDITQVRLKPGKKPPEGIRVFIEPLKGELPKPGEYVTTLTATSGDIKASIELKAVVTDLHQFSLTTESGRLNTDVIAGKENHLKILVKNTGTATLSKIALVAFQPEQWVVKFEPNMVENIAPGSSKEVDMLIKPPRKTIAGDYMIELKAFSGRSSASAKLRATVPVPPLWRAVGMLIVLATLAGVGIMYRRLSQR